MKGAPDEGYAPRARRRSSRHRLRGVDYHVSEWGEPGHPLIVMLHGWGDCGATFQFLVDALERAWFVVAPDWRGFGGSADAALAYWFPDYLADLDAMLAIYSPTAPAVLVGHSMGANAAGLYAGVMPERVAALVNIEGFGLPDRDPAEAPANYRRWLEGGRRMEPYSTYRDYDALAARIVRRNPGVPPERALYVARQWAAPGQDGMVRLRASPAHRLPNAVLYRRAEAAACWSRITAPVLAVRGADSALHGAAEDWLEAASAAAGAQPRLLETIPDSGHMVHLEQPERLAAALESFLVNTSSTV